MFGQAVAGLGMFRDQRVSMVARKSTVESRSPSM